MKKYLLILCFFTIHNIFADSYNAVLFVGTNLSSQEKLTAMTVAGIVNRDSARVFLYNLYETWSYSQNDEKWSQIYKQSGNVKFDTITTVAALINRFRAFIKGGITYAPNRIFSNFSGQSFMWQGEYAALIGGLTNRLPVTTSQALSYNLTIDDSVLVIDEFDGDLSIKVPAKLELTNHIWNNTTLSEESKYLSILNWGIQYLLPRCNPQKFYIREITDFTIKYKMFQVNLAGTNSLDLNSMPAPRADVLESSLTYLQQKNNGKIFHIYGWIHPEPMTQWFAFFGTSFHETLLGNMSWHTSFPVAERVYLPPAMVNPDTITLENKYYITFVGTEGDASNWVIGLQSGAWLSQARGSVPLNWGWNLHLLELCPFIASYYYDTATPNDGFISVTSPLGYAFPDLWSASVLPDVISETKRLMSKFNINEIYAYKHYAGAGTMVYRGKTINNSFNFQNLANFQNNINARLTMLFDPQLISQRPVLRYNALMFNHTNDGSFYGDASSLDNMANRIITNIKSLPNPGFLLAGYQRLRQDDFANRTDPSDSDISIPRLLQVVNKIKADPIIGNKVEVVTVEKMSILMRKFMGLSQTEQENVIPQQLSLKQNYPNPFNPFTTIEYSIPNDSFVNLSVYNILGQKVTELVNDNLKVGYYSSNFNGSNLASGIYIYTIRTEDLAGTKFYLANKMALLK
ncbi:MAG: GxGYxYP domain-containing protein [bacterium]